MIARRPDAGSLKKVTCSWPATWSKTLIRVRSPTASSMRVRTVEGSRGAWLDAVVTASGGAGGFAAHLRVYQPLAAFEGPERERWAAYVESGDAPSRPVLMAREHSVGLAAALAVPPRLSVPAVESAYVRHLDGLSYVCPWRLQERTWEALAEF